MIYSPVDCSRLYQAIDGEGIHQATFGDVLPSRFQVAQGISIHARILVLPADYLFSFTHFYLPVLGILIQLLTFDYFYILGCILRKFGKYKIYSIRILFLVGNIIFILNSINKIKSQLHPP